MNLKIYIIIFELIRIDLKNYISNLDGNCILIVDYNNLVRKFKYFSESIEELYKLRIKSFKFAKDSLIWENTTTL